MRAILLVALVILGGCSEQTQAYVECVSNGSGYTCTTTHKAGSDRVEACWDVVVVCKNKARAVGHGCQEVAPSGKATTMLGPEAFKNGAACDEMMSMSVENVALKVK